MPVESNRPGLGRDGLIARGLGRQQARNHEQMSWTREIDRSITNDLWDEHRAEHGYERAICESEMEKPINCCYSLFHLLVNPNGVSASSIVIPEARWQHPAKGRRCVCNSNCPCGQVRRGPDMPRGQEKRWRSPRRRRTPIVSSAYISESSWPTSRPPSPSIFH